MTCISPLFNSFCITMSFWWASNRLWLAQCFQSQSCFLLQLSPGQRDIYGLFNLAKRQWWEKLKWRKTAFPYVKQDYSKIHYFNEKQIWNFTFAKANIHLNWMDHLCIWFFKQVAHWGPRFQSSLKLHWCSSTDTEQRNIWLRMALQTSTW